MHFIEKIKQHPVLAAALVGAVLLLVLVISRRGGSSSASVSSGIDPTTASLYAQNAQITAQATMQANQLDAAAVHDTTLANYGLSLAKIQSDATTQQNNTAASVSMAQIAAQTDVQKQSIAANLQGLQLQAGVQTAGIEAALRGLESNNSTTVQIAQLSAQEQLGIANLTAQTQIGISNNQSQVAIAQTNAAAGVAKGAQSSSMWGSIIGGAFSLGAAFLSDDRTKENVVYIGKRRGFRIYEFNFIGDATRYRGVMAQEVARARPDAVNDNGGVLSVDYARLGLTMERVA